MNVTPRTSVAVPLHNEESVLPELLRRVTAVLDSLPGGPHELVLVDDGSTDATLGMLEAAAAQEPRITVISLSRNFGHQQAITAALDHTTGDVTVVMDGDLQDNPEAIPQFLAQHAEGYDVVYARRLNRKESWWLRLSYWTYYRLLARLSQILSAAGLRRLRTDVGARGPRVASHARAPALCARAADMGWFSPDWN
jgi:dolichol-phosphate mannosyltransferase